ncbi:hypothetical protein NHX12_001645, partial [Muraenolepis orangiensis]
MSLLSGTTGSPGSAPAKRQEPSGGPESSGVFTAHRWLKVTESSPSLALLPYRCEPVNERCVQCADSDSESGSLSWVESSGGLHPGTHHLPSDPG